MMRYKPARALSAMSFAVFTSVQLPFAALPTTSQGTPSLAVSKPGAPAAGYTFEMVTKSTSSSPMAGPASGMTASGIAASDGSMRMDITAVDGASSVMSSVGDYYIMKDGKMLLARPGTKTYLDIGDQAMSALSAMPPEMLQQLSITDITATSEKVAGSETIDGRPTEHMRTTVGYSMGIMGQSLPTTIVTDFWLAKLAVPMINPMAGMKSALTTGPMAELIKKQMEIAPSPASGLALKAVITQTVMAMGQSIVSTVTTEMKNLKEGDVDASRIAIPDGYTKATK